MKYAIFALALSIGSLGFTLPQAATAYGDSVRIEQRSYDELRVRIVNPTLCSSY